MSFCNPVRIVLTWVIATLMRYNNIIFCAFTLDVCLGLMFDTVIRIIYIYICIYHIGRGSG